MQALILGSDVKSYKKYPDDDLTCLQSFRPVVYKSAYNISPILCDRCWFALLRIVT